jgi:hypothetical protein
VPKKKAKLPLSKTHPKLAKEADGWDPKTVTAGSGIKMDWKCKLGHTWLTTPSHRARGQGCPYCSGRRLLQGFNDLKTMFPEIANDADGWDPKLVIVGSSQKVNWVCKLGHKWNVAIEYRTRGLKSGCPVCAGKAVHPGFNDLATTNPEVAKEAFGWDPSTVTQSSGKKFKWKCTRGHIYDAAIYSRTGKNSSGCPVCSNRRIVVGENDLGTTHPQIAAEADGWNPTTVSAGVGGKKYGWLCPKGHKYKSFVYSRTNGTGCPVCANLSIEIGENDLATTHPRLVLEADGWDPTKIVSGNSHKFKWLCNLGHSYSASVVSRANKGTGCPICSNKIVLVGFNDLATTHPHIANEAVGWDPTSVTSGTHKKLAWKCINGHIWNAIVNTRIRGNNCPICSNQITESGVNDLETTNPEIAKESYGWDPSEVNAGSHKKMKWKCSLGHIWEAAVFTRMRGKGDGCPFCSNHRVLVGFNDLTTTHPHLIPEVYNWDPTKVTAGSGLKKKWKCTEEHIWETVVAHRTGLRKTGCPSCAKFGFKPDHDAYLYLLEQEEWKMLQIGITNDLENRLNRHKGLGWEVVELRGPMDGHLTQQWETAILRMLKAKGADLSNSNIAGKFDGYSEAWSKSTFPVKSIRELMRLTEEFEENQ